MHFEIEGNSLIEFLKETTNLYDKFSARDTSNKDIKNDIFLDFCVETIENEAEDVYSVRIARTYYGEVDCYHARVMGYQGIYFVWPSPEHDPIGYFFIKADALAAADQFASEVYDDYAEKEYEAMTGESD